MDLHHLFAPASMVCALRLFSCPTPTFDITIWPECKTYVVLADTRGDVCLREDAPPNCPLGETVGRLSANQGIKILGKSMTFCDTTENVGPVASIPASAREELYDQ